jgi:hypothetical protein
MLYSPEFKPSFIISTQNILFMALHQAASAGIELADKLQTVIEEYDLTVHSDHPDYVNLLKANAEQFSE